MKNKETTIYLIQELGVNYIQTEFLSVSGGYTFWYTEFSSKVEPAIPVSVLKPKFEFSVYMNSLWRKHEELKVIKR